MSQLQAILESEETAQMINENQDLFESLDQMKNDFPKVLKNYILENRAEFISNNLEETQKNIRIFSEVAMNQFLAEISAVGGSLIHQQQVVQEQEVNAYL